MTAVPAAPILLVDDEEQALRSYDLNLRYEGLTNVIRCSDSRKVRSILQRQDISLALVDLCMPHVGGEEVIDLLKAEHPQVPIIVVTGFNEVDTAVRCMRAGAQDYLVKPVDRSRLVSAVRQALAVHQAAGTADGQAPCTGRYTGIVTRNETMKSICRYIAAVAVTPEPVLITGETGVGKEMIARAIHDASDRRGRFVAVNVAGLDDNMFADTLFGHTRGAFTGANMVRSGLIEEAAGGCLFLDEVGDLSPASQLKLLRLIQEKEYYPLGSDVSKAMDAKLVVATNKSTQELLDAERFRRDLFFRLRTHYIQIPSLRERLDDLPVLVEHFFDKAAAKLGKQKPAVPAELLRLLGGYHFPGNVRELESMIFNAMTVHDTRRLTLESFEAWIGTVRGCEAPTRGCETPARGCETPARGCAAPASGVPAAARPPAREPAPGETATTLRQARERTIQDALAKAGGNQSLAARMLGISRQALNRHLRQKRK